jgi:AraC-like DNA-binding protein
MVSNRCKMLVMEELEKLGLNYESVELGEAEIKENITIQIRNELNLALKNSGIELIEDKKSILIEKIKGVIIEYVHYSEKPLEINFSEHLSQKLNHDYTYLANLFSESQGKTIEHFLIEHKIECVKRLLVYNDLNISEISRKLGYSSIAHLSNQFKKVTGISPSFFKKTKDKALRNLEDI